METTATNLWTKLVALATRRGPVIEWATCAGLGIGVALAGGLIWMASL